jgi:LysM repeat protein
VNRDDEIEGAAGRDRTGELFESEPPVAQDSDESTHQPGLSLRSRTGMGAWQPPTAPLSPLRVPSGSLNRNVPSHPAWEKPPSPYNYPRIRGQEKPKSMAPLIIAAVAVVLILGAVVVLPALTGRKGTTPVAPGSSSPSAIVSNGPLQSAAPSQSVGSSGGTPAPIASFQQYKVQAGDSVAKIAGKFHLQRWELLLANPQLTAPAYAVRLNTFLNIPLPGTLTQPPATPTDSPTASLGATLVAP